MELCVKIVNGWKPLFNFGKSSILDVRLDSEYDSVEAFTTFYCSIAYLSEKASPDFCYSDDMDKFKSYIYELWWNDHCHAPHSQAEK